MKMLHKGMILSLSILIVFNIVSPIIVLGATLPDFAVVESSGSNVETNEVYKKVESSVSTAATPNFNFQSSAQILMEASTGEIIYANKENERLLPASVTKIMTLLITMEKIDSGALKYTDTLTCSAQASKMGGSQIWFKEGETLTIDEALKCICVVSANDVSYAIAELIGGSHDNFVQMMNEKAKELGMVNTSFKNAHGIDEDGHYTTAKDIAIMSRELITKHPDILKYTTIWMDSIRNGTFDLANTNKLLKTYQGMTGLKTGSTSQAGFNLSGTAQRDGLSLIAVVLKAPSSQVRNEEITALLNYGFSSYTSKKLAQKGEVADTVNINKYIGGKINVYFENDEYLIAKKGETKKYTTKVTYTEALNAPLEANKVIGKMEFIDENGNVIHEANLVIHEQIEKSNLWGYILSIMDVYSIKGLKAV